MAEKETTGSCWRYKLLHRSAAVGFLASITTGNCWLLFAIVGCWKGT